MRSLLLPILLVAACRSSGPGAGRQTPGQPVETRPPNASEQAPAFAGQTRAPFKSAGVAFEVKTLASGLEHPWGLAFLPDGRMLVTERPGRLRIVTSEGAKSEPVQGLPDVDARGQGGLLDVAVQGEQVTWCYAEPREGGNGTAVASGRLVGERLEDVKVLWRMTPTLDSDKHFGCRLVFTPDGHLFITTGERSIREGRRQARDLGSAFGKVIRIEPDGGVPADNPHVGKDGALPEVYSSGHRNIQSAALHPGTKKLWIVEHGAKGGDEINVVAAGKDYGWPTITYGEEYSGEPIGDGLTAQGGLEQPIYYWDPVIAPSGMAFYTGDAFPAWRGSLFVGGLAGQHVARLTLDGERVVGEERLLAGKARFRDVRVGPDGRIYLLTDEDDGQILVLAPR